MHPVAIAARYLSGGDPGAMTRSAKPTTVFRSIGPAALGCQPVANVTIKIDLRYLNKARQSLSSLSCHLAWRYRQTLPQQGDGEKTRTLVNPPDQNFLALQIAEAYPTATSDSRVRKYITPSEIAGVAITESSSLFIASLRNSGPAAIA